MHCCYSTSGCGGRKLIRKGVSEAQPLEAEAWACCWPGRRAGALGAGGVWGAPSPCDAPPCGCGNGGERAGSAPPGISHPPHYVLFPELWRQPLFLLNHRHEGEKAPKLAGAPPWTRRAWSHGLCKAEPAPKTWGLCPHLSLGTGLSLLCPTPYPSAEALTTALLCRRHLLPPLPGCSILWGCLFCLPASRH